MLQAYKNDTKLKTKFVKEIRWHEQQDKIIQGIYGEGSNGDWKGCAVGCSIHSLNRLENKNFSTNNHALYETELGIPEWLARLEDTIFEGLPTEEAKKWPLRFSKAINVGANLDPIKWQFSAYLMKQNIDRVLSLDISDELKEQVVSAIRQVLAVHEEAIKTGEWDESAAWSAESAADSAWSADSAARSAESAAWSAESARSAAESARSAAESAWSARSAAESAWSARSAARSAAYIKHSKELLKLLRESN